MKGIVFIVLILLIFPVLACLTLLDYPSGCIIYHPVDVISLIAVLHLDIEMMALGSRAVDVVDDATFILPAPAHLLVEIIERDYRLEFRLVFEKIVEKVY